MYFHCSFGEVIKGVCFAMEMLEHGTPTVPTVEMQGKEEEGLFKTKAVNEVDAERGGGADPGGINKVRESESARASERKSLSGNHPIVCRSLLEKISWIFPSP